MSVNQFSDRPGQVAGAPPAIRIRGLVKTYGSTRALDGVDFTVESGESHALLGRNGAGKSTLIGLLTGLVQPDAGEIEIFSAPGADAEGPGADTIACVFQKSTLIPALTAAENISLNRYPVGAFRRVNWKEMRAHASALLAEWGYERLVDTPVEDVEPLERKVIEICRALSRGPRILLLDEPTAGLDGGAVNELFSHISAARQRGVTVVYVSHHLQEIFQVCDRATILRDGKDVHMASVADLTVRKIVEEMAGDSVGSAASATADLCVEQHDFSHQPVVLDVAAARVSSSVSDVTLQVRHGECVGITGLDGAGHIQLAKAIAGQLSLESGTIHVAGRLVRPGDVMDAIRAGIGFMPEDRHIAGFAPEMSVEENATLPIIQSLKNPFGLVSGSKRRQKYSRLARAWAIKAARPTQWIQELSGGNQQKVVLARALSSDPRVLVLMHPTSGVDVHAKESIYSSLDDLRREGCSMVIASADDADLRICDRVVVMFNGVIHAQLERNWSERELVSAVQGES